jgi:Matrixin
LLLGFGWVQPVSAYVLEDSHWFSPTVQMRVQLGKPTDIVLADGSLDWNASIENAMQLWNEQMAGTQFTWTVAPPGTPAADGDGTSSMQFSDTVYGDKFGENVLAVTLIDANGSANTETDILFNNANRFNSYRGLYAIFNGVSYFDIHRIALHELGHSLGLDHPDDFGQTVNAIMNAHVSGLYVLQTDDIDGVVALYGAPPNPPFPVGNAQILQLSTRGSVGTGDEVMIGGFIIQGGTSKKVIVRAIGPSLTGAGVAGALQNPVLELHDGTGALIQSNDDWRDAQEQEIIDTTVPPTDDLESAIVADLTPGNYTAIVSGAAGGTGVALVEVYDLEPDNGKLANISTRAHVDTGDNALIGGFIVKGPQSEKNIIRALGPSLTSSGVTGALPNPTLDLYNGDGGLLQSNDDFSSNRDAETIRAYGLGLDNAYESGLYFESAPGNFTAVVRGANNSSGVALVEIYGVN